jgi:hypothetical protein
VFDLLWVNGRDLRGLSLVKRKARLERVLPENSPTVFKVLTIGEYGIELFQQLSSSTLKALSPSGKTTPMARKLPGTRSRIPPTRSPRAGASCLSGVNASVAGHADLPAHRDGAPTPHAL